MPSASAVPTVPAVSRPLFFFLLLLPFASCQLGDLRSSDKDNNPGIIATDSTATITTGEPVLTVYLSFDDGPQAGTATCLRICNDAGVKATFFMVGMHNEEPARHPLVEEVRNNPRFLLANHSYTHAYSNRYHKFYSRPEAAMADFDSAEKMLNIPVKIVRFPGNDVWVLNGSRRTTRLTKALAERMDSLGYSVMGWDVEWKFKRYDHPRQNVEEMIADFDEVLKTKQLKTPGHMVLLAHDRMFHRSEDSTQLVQFIQALKQRPGYVFETLDKYPGRKGSFM